MNLIDHLTKLHAEATPGPWEDISNPTWGNADHAIRSDGREWAAFGYIAMAAPREAALIVATHSTLPQLLAVAKAAQIVSGQHNGPYLMASAEQVTEAIETLRQALAPLLGEVKP